MFLTSIVCGNFFFVGLENNCYLEIRKGSIDKRFYGVFAKSYIAANVIVGQYKGNICGVNDTISHYKHIIGKNEVIDAYEFLSCHGRYINDCVIDLENVKFKVNLKKKIIDIISLRVIEKDEEILTDYGPDYWEGNAAAMHSHDTNKTFCIKVAESKKRKLQCQET